MKAGWKTSEFWFNTVAMVCGIIFAAIGDEGSIQQIIGGIMASIAPASYNAGRAVVKGREAIGAAHVQAAANVAKQQG